MQELFDLSGKTALVTGASRGLGQAMAIALAKAGADVICLGSRPGSADETVKIIQELGVKSWAYSADLSNEKELNLVLKEVDKQHSFVEILVNNAGTIERYPAIDTPLDSWKRVLDINLTAPFIIAQHFAREMVKNGKGKIINTASLLSFSGGITVPSYASSKHGIAGLTKALANEWAQYGIQVNAIAPGYFKTDNTQALQDNEERFAQISTRIPTGKWGEPGQLAGAAVFLASKASDYINGHVLTVDGGWMAR